MKAMSPFQFFLRQRHNQLPKNQYKRHYGPMLAMTKIRTSKAAFGPGSSFGATAQTRPGSPEMTLTFENAAKYKEFQDRLAAVEIPDHLLFGQYNAELGALEFIDRRTGRGSRFAIL